MLLAVDVGNTNTVFGIAGSDGAWPTRWRITTLRTAVADDWAAIIAPLATRDGIELTSISAVAVGSVVPAATVSLGSALERLTGSSALIVRSDLDLGIRLGMDNPGEVGADRIANAVAARNLTRKAAIVVDLGTATKVEAIDECGTFLGGAIAPGIGVTLEALTSRAARLFAIDLVEPDTAIGRSTGSAMQAGLVRGHIHLIRGLIQDVTAELGGRPRVIVTGGHTPIVFSALGPEAIHVPNLTLDGIRLIYRRNRQNPAT
jgi:type III pantothenate kinase